MSGSAPWPGAPRPSPRRVRHAVAGAIVATLLLGVAAPSTGAEEPRAADLAPDASVSAWDSVGSQAFTAAGLTPAEGHVIFAYVAIAVYDSVVAIHPLYEPFLVRDHAPPTASAEAAVAASAHRILAHYLPAQATTIVDPAYTAFLAAIIDGPDKTDGIAVGERVASAVIAARAGDGFRAPMTYTPPNPPVPGIWIPTASTPPIGVYLGHMRPFALASSDQFRPAGPPALGSRRWARDYREVQAIGSSTSTTRTPAQTTAARFWAEPPVQQARGSFRRFLADHQLDVLAASRFMAMVSVVYADALIACFEAKYHYRFWRPITAIRAGGTDGNALTIGDPAWSPLLAATPNHPEYPSAHSCITPAGGIVAARFLDTDEIDFTVPSLTGLGDRTFATVGDLTSDVTNARIWGGIHYRSSVKDGVAIARRTTSYVLARNFKPVDD